MQNAGKLFRALVPALSELGLVATFSNLVKSLFYKLKNVYLGRNAGVWVMAGCVLIARCVQPVGMAGNTVTCYLIYSF